MEKIFSLILFFFYCASSSGQKHELRFGLAYSSYEDNFFVPSYSQLYGVTPSRSAPVKPSVGLTYGYFFDRYEGWFMDAGINYANRSVLLVTNDAGGVFPISNVTANYLDLSIGLGYEIEVMRKFSITPRLSLGYGVPLQSKREQVEGPIRDPDVNYTNPTIHTSIGASFRLYYKETKDYRFWIGMEPRFLVFYTNMFDLDDYPLSTDLTPNLGGSLELQVGYAFW